MSLALFDLDNTLIGGDSDYLWGEFLCDIGAVDREYYEEKNKYFYEQYSLGKLDIYAYSEFSMEPLSKYSMSELNSFHKRFMQDKIESLFLPKAEKVINWHKDRGDTLIVITASNNFVTAPIVSHYEIDNLISTELEVLDGQYTGNVLGTPCYKNGKVEKLSLWLRSSKESLDDSTFYSDSHNDLPLLELVTNPVAVNPDEKLNKAVIKNGWKSVDWR
jgi:HAD superfamily hydrolase (TIGR01490 family)